MLGTIYSKPIAYILLRGAKREFPLKSAMRQGFPLHAFLFDAMPEVLATEIRQGESKRDSNRKRRHLTIANGVILYLKDQPASNSGA